MQEQDALKIRYYRFFCCLFTTTSMTACSNQMALLLWYSRKHETSLGFHTSTPIIIVTEIAKPTVATAGTAHEGAGCYPGARLRLQM